VLSDASKSDAFRQSPHWRSPLLDFQLRVKQETLSVSGDTGPQWRSNSFSGHERNRLLLQSAGGFQDLSLVSGTDCREDARSFAMLDYDGDGWLDIALMSTNAPRFRLFRNRMAGLANGGRVLTLRLEGGNHRAQSGEMSTRDAAGALVFAVTDKGRRVFRRSTGEGLASQNSAVIRITLAPGETLRALEVQWPSGRRTTHQPPAGNSVRLSEAAD
jgi:hypothetical protein